MQPIQSLHCIIQDYPSLLPYLPTISTPHLPISHALVLILPYLLSPFLDGLISCPTLSLKMATNSLPSLHHHHHHHHRLRRRHSIDCLPTTLSSSSSFFPKPTKTTTCLSQSLSFTPFSTTSSSSSSSSSTTTTPQSISFDLLQQHLSSKNFRQADEETRRLLIVLAGEAAQKRGYVFFSEVQFICESDLKTIDELWRKHSDSRFGYSVQKKIWKKVGMDFTRFFLKVGWMKKLDTEIEQYNYRSFPNEFIWELNDDTPEGHLPLTNALRGTQLLNRILSHPAFENGEGDDDDDDDDDNEEGEKGRGGETGVGEENKESDNGGLSSKHLSQRVFKPDYSF